MRKSTEGFFPLYSYEIKQFFSFSNLSTFLTVSQLTMAHVSLIRSSNTVPRKKFDDHCM